MPQTHSRSTATKVAIRSSRWRAIHAATVIALVAATVAWPVSAQAIVAPTVTSYTVPAGVVAVSITVKGASGEAPSGGSGGAGGVVTSTISVSPGQILQLNSGAVGGGGPAGTNNLNGPAGAGGGASDVRIGACAATLSCSPTDRVIVAGGGGGAGGGGSDVQCGGAGGANTDGSGLKGCEETSSGPDWPKGGRGASATSVGAGGLPSNSTSYGGNAGAAGSGPSGGTGGNGNNSAGGGGGGGYFGGGGGAGVDFQTSWIPGGGGGGGSSWASPTLISSRFDGATSFGDGSISISRTATLLSLTQAETSSLAYTHTRVLTATITDTAGNVVDSGSYSTSTVTFTYTSGVGAVTGLGAVTAINGVATLTVTGSAIGAPRITATTATLTSNALTVTVVKADQAITFAQPTTPRTFGSTFSALATATASLTTSITATGGCSIAGSTVTMTSGATDCTLTASQAGNEFYEPATDVVRTIVASKAPQAAVISTGVTTGTYGSSYTISASGGSGTGSYAFSHTGACSLSGSTTATVSVTMIAGGGSCIVTTTRATDGNFAGASVTKSISATKKALTIRASDATITYRDATPPISAIYSGLTNGDTAPLTAASCATAVDSTTTVGTYASSCSGSSDANYELTYVAGTVTVLISDQEIRFSQPTTPAIFNSTFTVAPISTSDLTVTVTASGGCSVVGFDVTMTSGTTDCTLVASQMGSKNFRPVAFPVSRVVGAVKIEQAALGLTSPADAAYGDTFEVTAAGGSGTGENSFSVASGSVCSIGSTSAAGASVTLTAGVGSCFIVNDKATDGNYLGASTSIEIAAKPAVLRVVAVATSKSYGDVDPAFTFELSGLIVGDNDSVTSGLAECARLTGEDVGSYTITCAPGSLTAANYTFTQVTTAEFSIEPRALTITASDATTHFGEERPIITPSYDNVTGGDSTTAIPPICTTDVDTSAPAGTYPSTCSGAIDANYAIDYIAGAVVVEAASQTITFEQPNPASFGSSFLVAPIASSRLTVAVTASGGCTISGTNTKRVTITSGSDPCRLVASQGGNQNFTPTQLRVDVVTLPAAPAPLTASGPRSAGDGEPSQMVPSDEGTSSGNGASSTAIVAIMLALIVGLGLAGSAGATVYFIRRRRVV